MPTSDGEIELHLTGPWEEKEPGLLWRQEVLWDDIDLDGAKILNGDFSDKLEGWDSPWRAYPDAGDWPLLGQEVGASWHGRPLTQKLTVRKGRKVNLRFKARAAVPPGFAEPKRLQGETPAHRAAAKLKRGVNLGNCWEAPPDSWGMKYSVEDVDRIAASGFDHIRVPVGWHFRMRDGKIDDDFLAELEPVLDRAIAKGLYILLDWHHFEDLCREPEKNTERFVEGWRVIANHFKDASPRLFFELLNEPNGPLQGEVLNDIHAAALKAIRGISPNRIVVVNPGGWAVVGKLGALRLPDNEDRVIVSVHCYNPFEFTHQGAAWVGLEDLKGVVFPGPPKSPLALPSGMEGRAQWVAAYNSRPTDTNPSSLVEVERLMAEAREWSDAFGRPVHLGEFGCFQTADPESRKRYARGVRTAAESHGIPWCWWEWKAGFGCWDPTAQKPLLIDELIGR
jgi:hypothetical protein